MWNAKKSRRKKRYLILPIVLRQLHLEIIKPKSRNREDREERVDEDGARLQISRRVDVVPDVLDHVNANPVNDNYTRSQREMCKCRGIYV